MSFLYTCLFENYCTTGSHIRSHNSAFSADCIYPKVPSSISNWSNFSLWSKRKEAKNPSRSSRGSSGGRCWTKLEPPSPWFLRKNQWGYWVTKNLPILYEIFDIWNRHVRLVLPILELYWYRVRKENLDRLLVPLINVLRWKTNDFDCRWGYWNIIFCLKVLQ